MIKTSFNNEENIIYAERTGDIRIRDLVELVHRITQEHHGFRSLYILDDVRKSSSHFEASEYHLIIEEISKVNQNYQEIKHAIVVDNPSDTVLSILYEKMAPKLGNYYYKTFSTPEAAKFWLTF